MAINPHEAIGEHVKAQVLFEEEKRRLDRLAMVEKELDWDILRAGRRASVKSQRTIYAGRYEGHTSNNDLRKNLDLLPDVIKRYEAAGWIVEHKTEDMKIGKWKFVDHYLSLTAPIQKALKGEKKSALNVRHGQSTPNPHSGYVYLLEAENGLYKIGRSKQPKFRIAEITKAVAPFEIKEVHKAWYEDCHAVESALHRRYANRRKRGEWFELTPQEAREVVNHAFNPA